MKTKVDDRGVSQICISFGREEKGLLKLLDKQRKQEHISRSAWFKNQIREKYGNQSPQNLYALY